MSDSPWAIVMAGLAGWVLVSGVVWVVECWWDEWRTHEFRMDPFVKSMVAVWWPVALPLLAIGAPAVWVFGKLSHEAAELGHRQRLRRRVPQ